MDAELPSHAWSLTSRVLFFLHAPAPSETYTLSLHDALPISGPDSSRIFSSLSPISSMACSQLMRCQRPLTSFIGYLVRRVLWPRSEETRLNSSHVKISYAVFCLKKKNTAKSN